MKRVVLVCPGRGTYTKAELGTFGRAVPPAVDAWRAQLLDTADAVRSARGDVTLRELDSATAFGARHMAGENAADLIFAAGLVDAMTLDPAKAAVVAVCGNSMGWYTALAVAGAVNADDGFRVADTMGGMQRGGPIGGQVVWPVVDDAWRMSAAAVATVEHALADARAAGHDAGWSIHLGGTAVLWSTSDGVKFLLTRLPKVKVGEREYPFQLQGHAAFHSPLLHGVSERAKAELADIAIDRPVATLIDGRGAQWRPLTTDPAALFDYTFGHQITETYDFTASIRVALREFAPDALVLLGPGDNLGGAIAQIVIAEGWAGIRSRADFMARQESKPILIALARPAQASLVVAG